MTDLIVFAESYPYLTGCFLSILLFLICLIFSPAQRRPMLLSALLFTPFALTAIVLVPVYWKPKLFWNLMVGVEDIIFCFFTGGIVWLLSISFIRPLLILPGRIRPLIKRYIQFILYGAIIISAFLSAGVGYLWSILATLYLLGLFLLINHKHLWPVALGGGTTFLVFYLVILKTMFFSWPHFLYQWNLPALSGLFLGMPLEELIWALGFGFTWPLLMAHVFDIQIRRPVFLD